jgi:hypothetical protein
MILSSFSERAAFDFDRIIVRQNHYGEGGGGCLKPDSCRRRFLAKSLQQNDLEKGWIVCLWLHFISPKNQRFLPSMILLYLLKKIFVSPNDSVLFF